MNLNEILTGVIKSEEHTFKCESPWWSWVATGAKTFEVRMHDPEKPVKTGDTIWLQETSGGVQTGRELRARVTLVFPLKSLDNFYTPPCARHYYMMECPMEVWGLDKVMVAQ